MPDVSGEHSLGLFVLFVALILLLAGSIAVIATLVQRNTALQRRNDSLSDILTKVVQISSDERLALTQQHADQREKLRVECMLQLDSTQRNIMASFTQMLLEKLKELRWPPRPGSERG